MSKLDELGFEKWHHEFCFVGADNDDECRKGYVAARRDIIERVEELERQMIAMADNAILRNEELACRDKQLQSYRELAHEVIEKSAAAGNDAGLAGKYLTELEAKAREIREMDKGAR